MRMQLVGFPLRTYRRIRDQLDAWAESLRPDVDFRPAPSLRETPPFLNESVINLAKANVQDGYVHLVVAVSRDWKRLRDLFTLDCRVILLRAPTQIEDITWEELRQSLEMYIDYEKRWWEAVCPKDVRHALLLPPPSFKPERHLRGFWHVCDVYRDVALIERAQQMLKDVAGCHRRKAAAGQCWIDIGGRRFKNDPSHHGLTIEERAGGRRFRFCMEVPVGFHYDVDRDAGDEFWIYDLSGNRHRTRHANVDPWGMVRI